MREIVGYRPFIMECRKRSHEALLLDEAVSRQHLFLLSGVCRACREPGVAAGSLLPLAVRVLADRAALCHRTSAQHPGLQLTDAELLLPRQHLVVEGRTGPASPTVQVSIQPQPKLATGKKSGLVVWLPRGEAPFPPTVLAPGLPLN